MYAPSSNVPNGHHPSQYNNLHPSAHQPHPNQHGPIAPGSHPQQPAAPPHAPVQRPPAPPISKEPITVVGIPSVSIQDNRLVVGNSQSSSTRSYTPLKVLGDGSFGTVWLCDWHGTLPPNTPLSPMQCGAGARPEWAGKRLVAVKRMKKKWEGGWDECQKLKELESLRAIPFHPNIIPLYDFFLLPTTKELYFVFESMEGNLYHLIKTRKGRFLAGGLVASIFRQIVVGLDHIHSSGYFHRDMKPENVLVTTTGLFKYNSVSPVAPPNTIEEDVVAIIKLADFGLARETKSKPPYTEYVSTRWYRAPEVLLLSRDYSNPVDMWALGTIMAELVNLKPLFPGSDQIDQMSRICDLLGDPSDEYGMDLSHRPIGGGSWSRGIKMAKAVGFQFTKIRPKDIHSLFDKSVPVSLVRCIRDLLRYDPEKRLTTQQCLQHPYFLETLPRNNIPIPPGILASTSNSSVPSSTTASTISIFRAHNGVHPHSEPHSFSQRPLYDPNLVSIRGIAPPRASHPSEHDSEQLRGLRAAPGWPHQNGDVAMDTSPDHADPHLNGSQQLQENGSGSTPLGSKLSKFTSLAFGKKSAKRGLGMFGGEKSHHHTLPPVDEVPGVIPSMSLKRTQSSSTDSRSLRDSSPIRERTGGDAKKINKKEAERLQLEAEKQRRKLLEKSNREQARAVMQKRNQMMQKSLGDIEWLGGNEPRLHFSASQTKGKAAASGPIRQSQGHATPSATINAAAGRYGSQPDSLSIEDRERERRGSNERSTKARRREFDDDHSMSSSDVRSIGHLSAISFATVDSDPGPSRIRNRPSLFGINRMTSVSSLRTSFDDFSPSARSSNSFSLEAQLAHDFRIQASVDGSHMAGSVSPPPMQMLSLSPTLSPPLSPSPPWIQVQQDALSPPYIAVPLQQDGTYNAFEINDQLNPHPPSSGHTPKSAQSVINPIFKVPPLSPDTGDSLSSPNSLPPFSQLEAVAGGQCPPLSPMSFITSPSEEG